MTRWLYDSDGEPVAYFQGEYLFTARGVFVGKLYEDNTIWNGEYIGEIMADDRFVFDERKLKGSRGIPGQPGLPGFAAEPEFKGPFSLPLGFRDVEFR